LQNVLDPAMKNGPQTVFQHRAALTTTQGYCDMAKADLPAPELLRKLLDYNPETGAMVWRERDASLMGDDLRRRQWNTRYAGTPALAAHNGTGYCTGRIFGRFARAHQVVYAIYHGEWPGGLIDHINGDKTDNRIANLRIATPSQNCQNIGLRSTNTSGYKGVCRYQKSERWRAQIRRPIDGKGGGKKIYLGVFDTAEEAHEAYCRAALEFHGEFANFDKSEPMP
jgi:hypothetical protein